MEERREIDKILEKGYNVPEEIEELANDLGGGQWNYRLIEKESHWTNKAGKEYFEKYFEIHEVYYKGDGEIWGWSENPMSIYFENFKEVGYLVKQIRAATRKPVLRLVKGEDGEEELVPTMKTLKEYKKVDLSNWCSEDFWKEIEETENETRRE